MHESDKNCHLKVSCHLQMQIECAHTKLQHLLTVWKSNRTRLNARIYFISFLMLVSIVRCFSIGDLLQMNVKKKQKQEKKQNLVLGYI